MGTTYHPRCTPVTDSASIPLLSGGYEGDINNLRTYQSLSNLETARSITDNVYGLPVSFSLYPTSDSWEVAFLPWIAASAEQPYTVRCYMYRPQEELETDGSDDGTVMDYHTNTLLLGTLWLALNERGEEIGEPGNMAQEQYQRALSDAIYTDMQAQAGRGNQMEAWRD